jgi:hypothetical protein
MIQKILLGLLIFLVSACNSEPVIFVENNTIQLGKVSTNFKFSKKIKIYNKGRKDLIIKKLEKSCSCTNLAIESDTIKKNNFTELSFEIVFPDVSGKIENTICIRNNSKNEFYLIKIYAEVV